MLSFVSFILTCFSILESNDRLSQCKIPAIIKFLNEEQVSAHEIHRRLFIIYGDFPIHVIAFCSLKAEKAHVEKIKVFEATFGNKKFVRYRVYVHQ